MLKALYLEDFLCGRSSYLECPLSWQFRSLYLEYSMSTMLSSSLSKRLCVLKALYAEGSLSRRLCILKALRLDDSPSGETLRLGEILPRRLDLEVSLLYV